MNRSQSAGLLTGFILGALLGVAVGLLYAPQPGEETRRMMKEKALNAKDAAVKAAAKIKESVDTYTKRQS
jgi:gas vesicle protein